MKNLSALLFLITCAIGFSQCGDSTEPDAKVKPSNLVLTETVSTDGSGVVAFVATADDAVSYQFYFGEDVSAAPFISTDGQASHTYQNTGTYSVTVAAYSVDNLFVDKATSFTIQVNEPTISDAGYSTALDAYPTMNLFWQDEFNGDALNLSDWTHEIGNNNGWGNNELEYYQAANTTVHDGYLVIKAKKENVGGKLYTSSRIITKDKKEFKYGRVDIRAKLPKGQGIWPALWMLGANISEVSWPKCGEIDIMEMIGGGANRDNTVYGTLHWDDAGTKVCTCDKPGYSIPEGLLNDKFHVFTIVWDESFITWYVDDVQFNKIDIRPAELDEFQKDFFFIFNLAVGGTWPGNPDTSTIFPQRMVVDYIRVFQPK